MSLLAFELDNGGVVHLDPWEVTKIREVEGGGKKAAVIYQGDGDRVTVRDDNRDVARRINEARNETQETTDGDDPGRD